MSNVLDHDSFDTFAFERASEALAEIDQVIELGERKDYAFRSLAEDVFASLYKKRPTLLNPLPPGSEQHADTVRELMADPEHAKCRGTSTLDPTRSILMTLVVTKSLLAKQPEDKAEKRRLAKSVLRRAAVQTDAALENHRILSGLRQTEDFAGSPELCDLTEVVQANRALQGSPALKEILRIAGRLERLAFAKRRARVRHGPDEVTDVELGNDLSKVLPSELVQLGIPELKTQFLLRFVEKQLLQYRIEGVEPMGRGPLIVCVDSSYSMSAPSTAPEFWSKAVALALLSLARDEKRVFSLITFGSRQQVKQWTFETPPPVETIIEALEFSFRGGTDFKSPLDLALKTLEESAFKKGDVIMITDGECHVDDSWAKTFRRRKAVKGARLFSVLIGTESETLNQLSDGVERIDDLEDDEAVANLVFGSA